MAKAPPTRRRRVNKLTPEQVQPGSVGSTLGPGAGGAPLAADVEADSTETTEAKAETVRKYLETARKRLRLSADVESSLRTDMRDDLRFYNSDQWPQQILTERALDGRPCLTINRLPQFVRQVVNQSRESKPAIQVNPVDNGADPDTAEVIQGVMRNIERNSKAHVAYSTASEHQAIMGRGYWRILGEPAGDDRFEQEIKIRRVQDPLTVFPDPACVEPDYSDALFCLIVERVPKTAYVARYGEEALRDATDFKTLGDEAGDWYLADDCIQVAEYYHLDLVKAELVECQVGDVQITVYRDMLKDEDLQPGPNGEPARATILRKRDTVRRQLRWSLINGMEILEGNEAKTGGRDLPGPYIPVVPVLGEELVVDGKKNLRGMVRDAKDPQRAYNFWVSAETEMIALAPRAPVIGAAGQFEGHEEKWNTANRRNYPYLEYNAAELNGHLVPAPQRAQFDPNIGPIIQATMQADRDLKSVIGMFDASQERSQEQSGKAILARQRQGEQGNSHFLDNLSRSIEHTGRILLHWIPVYYDSPRLLRITGMDESVQKNVVVHAGQPEAADQLADDPLVQVILEKRPFDLSVGRYDVTISTGPSYQSRRQESVESVLALISSNPALAPFCADILVGNMDWPGARELAKRLERIVPQEARDPEKGAPQIPPEVQQQMQAMTEQLKATLEELQKSQEIIQSKAQELAAQGQIKQMELQSKERLAQIEAAAKLTQLQAEAIADAKLEVLKAKLEQIGSLLSQQHEVGMSAQDRVPPPPSSGWTASAHTE